MSVGVEIAVGERLKFGEFELAPVARTLWRHGEEIKLGSRALDILIALASRPGQIVSKDDLTKMVWRGALVDETALRVGISAVRKALGNGSDRYITTVPGRGYCFVLDVETTEAESAPEQTHIRRLRPQRLPGQIARVVGRDDVIVALAEEATKHRLLSVVGTGGIGKTTVAIAVADRLRSAFYAVAFVDLSAIENEIQVTAATATALGLVLRSQENRIDEIAIAVEGRRVLIVLDNCEHVIDLAAAFSETLLGRAPSVTVLATSRERLRAAGEWVHHLAPLAIAPDSRTLTADEAMHYPAIQLFVARAAAVLGGFLLDDSQAPLIANICRRLDGMALAIELATGRLDGMSIEELAISLEHCFEVLIRGRRTAFLRHQTLRGTLDWSFETLVPEEQRLFRRLAIFNGPFSLAAAEQVAGDGQEEAIGETLQDLVAKSLVTVSAKTVGARYRLLDTTRAYAREKLDEAGESHPFQRRHAAYYRDFFEADKTGWGSRSAADLAESAAHIGNLRTALEWAFSPQGDKIIGVALAAYAVPLWIQLSLVDECLEYVELALNSLDALPEPDARVRMRLYAGLGFPQMRSVAGFPSGADAWRSVLEIAAAIDDVDFQARAVRALWTDRVNNGQPREALQIAERFAALSATAPQYANPQILGRMRGWPLLIMGELDSAHSQLTTMLNSYDNALRLADLARFEYDQRSVVRIALAQLLWLRGNADQALWDIAANIAEMRAADLTLTLAHILSDAACFISLWYGDLELATRYIALLRKHTYFQALDVWRTYANCFEGEMLIRQGHIDQGVALLRASVSQLQSGGFVRYYSVFQGYLAAGLGEVGKFSESLDIIDDVLTRGERTGEMWARPELLRIRGEIYRRAGRVKEAEESFSGSLALGEAQGALAWRLRTAISVAKLRPDNVEATESLSKVVHRFQEGFGSEDFRIAITLLARANPNSTATAPV